MVLMLVFVGFAAYRGKGTPATRTTVTRVTVSSDVLAPSRFSWTTLPRRLAAFERELIAGPIENGIAVVESRIPASVDKYLIALWLIATSVLSLLMIAVQHRLIRNRRQWPIATLCGVRVRVAPDVGPAVIGVIHPDIVVPRWLLGRNDDEQRLVLAHE